MKTQTFNLEVVKNDFTRTFKGTKAVTILADAFAVEVLHYSTVICSVKAAGTVVLDNGGYYTATTKRHLNTCLERLGINKLVTQKKNEWYVGDQAFHRNFRLTK